MPSGRFLLAFTGQGHTYYETAVMTLLLVTLGRWLDAKTQVESTQANKDCHRDDNVPSGRSSEFVQGGFIFEHLLFLVIEDRVATGPSEDGHIHLFNAQREESVFRSVGQQIMISGPTAYILLFLS